jgi:hypothetical protein
MLCPDADPGRRGGKLATNRLSYGTALKLNSKSYLVDISYSVKDKRPISYVLYGVCWKLGWCDALTVEGVTVVTVVTLMNVVYAVLCTWKARRGIVWWNLITEGELREVMNKGFALCVPERKIGTTY